MMLAKKCTREERVCHSVIAQLCLAIILQEGIISTAPALSLISTLGTKTYTRPRQIEKYGNISTEQSLFVHAQR